MDYDVYFPSNLKNIDVNNDNVDVCIRFKDGREYSIVVITPENLSELMKKSCRPYILPDFKFLVAQTITKENIHQLISTIIEDKYLLEFYGSDTLEE